MSPPVPIASTDSADACPVPHDKRSTSPTNGGSRVLGWLRPKSAAAATCPAPQESVGATKVVFGDAETTIHYTPSTLASEIVDQIVAKLGLSFDNFHFITVDGHTVLDKDPATLVNFARLTIVQGQPEMIAIKGPRPAPIFGNVHQFAPDMTAALHENGKLYGKTFMFKVFDTNIYATTDPDVVQRVALETPFFTKKIAGVLKEIQTFAGHGLFTSDTTDPEWEPAHKMLMPTFSSGAMKQYMEDMNHVTAQMVNSFDQMHGHKMHVTEWMTRFTLQTIGVCGFGYDMHLLDSPDAPLHAFVDSMNTCLNESKVRFGHTRFYKMWPTAANANFESSMAMMQNTVDQVIAERKANPDPTKRDLLNFMLNNTTESGEHLSDANIRDQVITFLIAGHETTSTLLSWTLWLLTRNPAVEAKAIEEAVRVCGSDPSVPITFQQVGQLTYITQILKETLRLYPPAAVMGKTCTTSTTVKGVRINRGERVAVDLAGLHRSREVWGANPDVFNPDHFTKENEAKRHMFSWVPFSFGERSCIGMAFSLQESKIAIATLLRKFSFEYNGPVSVAYDKIALTLKPLDLFLTIHPRGALPSPSAAPVVVPAPTSAANGTADLTARAINGVALGSLEVVYGSNMGTSEAYAEQLVATAKRFGVATTSLRTLDDWAAQSTKKQGDKHVTVFITSTYNGNPPDNAMAAADWFKVTTATDAKPLANLKYAVFGCGNTQWRTFQAFPHLVDGWVATLGGQQVAAPGEGNADADIDGDWTAWHANFWTTLQTEYGLAAKGADGGHPMLAAEAAAEAATIAIHAGVTAAPVRPKSHVATKLTVNRELLTVLSGADAEWTTGKSTRHLEFTLAGDAPIKNYREGDHFEVWPENSPADVAAVAKHLGVSLDTVFSVSGDAVNAKSTAGIIGRQVQCSVGDALTYFVDLTGPLGKPLAEAVLTRQGRTAEAAAVRNYDAAAYKKVAGEYRRAIDAILAAPGIDLRDVVVTINGISPRRYSIASSSAKHPNTVALAVGVADGGLCSNFLQRAEVGHTIYTQIRPCNDAFHLPTAPEDMYAHIIMISAGTGISPFLGFLEERDARGLTAASGAAEAHMFYGCRHPDHDHVYAAEMRDYVARGVLTKAHVAYSRHAPSLAANGGVKYVQHAIAQEADLVMDLLARGGRIYICGSAKGMARDVFKAVAQMAHDKLGVDGDAYVQGLQAEGRYLEDVWG
ncbi:cytochrome P450 [Blastocladiella britannica]|nr:cytochrome P450 [Blastocladiella britannica]